MTTSKIIFLDFDGVLNNERWLLSGFEAPDKALMSHQIDPANVGLLNQLVVRTGANVVISSSWRIIGYHRCAALLSLRGFIGKAVGVTPDFNGSSPRGIEIQAWLTNAKLLPPEHIVILDDEAGMEHLEPWIVRTSMTTGLTQANVDRAVEILAKPAPGLTEDDVEVSA